MAELKSVTVAGAAYNGEDVVMEYAVFGNGPKAMILIPGLSLRSTLASADSVETSYKIFKDEYTVYLFDRRKNMPAVYPISEMAHDLTLAIKAIGLNKCAVVGMSQGGMIAQYMAINNPELFSHLVLCSTSSKAEPLQLEVIGNWAELARSGKADELVNAFIDNAFSPAFLQRYRRALLMMYKNLTEEELRRFAITAEACAGVNTFESLVNIKCPVFVIGADLDHVVTYKASEKIVARLELGDVTHDFYTYKGYGHAAFDEAKDYKKLILDFLQSF